MEKELVSEAAQTQYRDSETQFLAWDAAETPRAHPDKFPRGIGLHYPLLYDPAWPAHIAHRRKEKKEVAAGSSPPGRGGKRRKAPGSYALSGMTLGVAERRPIKKTLIFPHRNTDLPSRQPAAKDVSEPTFELCEKLTLQEINGIETRIILKSILENLTNYDKTNKEAQIKALQKLLNIQPRPQDKAPPLIKKRGKPKWRQAIEDEGKSLVAEGEDDEPKIVPQIIFADDGPKCSIHGFSALTQKRFCPLHNVEELKEEDIGKSDVKKDINDEVDEDRCRMCRGRNLHRKLCGEDQSSYPPTPWKIEEQGEVLESTINKEKEIKKGRGIWCPICKGFDIHRKVYEWPPRKEENEDSSSDENNDIDWCPMCKGRYA